MRADGNVTRAVADAALKMLDVDAVGLDVMDRKLLLAVIDKFDGGPVGVDNLAAAIGEERDTIEDVLEPYLIQQGYLQRTLRGRVATALAYRHFGLAAAARRRAGRSVGGVSAGPRLARTTGSPVRCSTSWKSPRTAIYGCFYCAGRDMKQRHMAWDLFERLLAGVPAGDHVVSLQGEGEPTVHPRFWDMVDAVRRRGLRPFTITNCSHVDAARFAASFPTFAVSIDTLDPAEADRIGRYKIDGMLKNLDALCAPMDPGRIHIMTVDYGQPLTAVREFARTRGSGTPFSRCRRKDDYAERYPDRITAQPRPYTYRCRYLDQPLRRYYDVEGREYPCCFIKDHRRHEPIETLRAKMAARQMPAACEGCHEVLAPENIAQSAHHGAIPGVAARLSIVTVCDAVSPSPG